MLLSGTSCNFCAEREPSHGEQYICFRHLKAARKAFNIVDIEYTYRDNAKRLLGYKVVT